MKGFFIWFEQRSGSSYLVSLLNSHPEIDCRGEMFGARRETRSETTREFRENAYGRTINLFPGHIANPSDEQSSQQLEDWLNEDKQDSEIHGFKFKHPSQHGLYSEVTKLLLQNADTLRLVVLQRQNFLRRAISLLNMQRLQAMRSTSNTKSNVQLPPLVADVKEVVRLAKYYADSQTAFLDFAKYFPQKIELEFEGLCKTPEEHGQQLQEFLGVKKVLPLTGQLKRITPESIPDAVANFAELKAELESAGLDNYLR